VPVEKKPFEILKLDLSWQFNLSYGGPYQSQSYLKDPSLWTFLYEFGASSAFKVNFNATVLNFYKLKSSFKADIFDFVPLRFQFLWVRPSSVLMQNKAFDFNFKISSQINKLGIVTANMDDTVNANFFKDISKPIYQLIQGAITNVEE
jgi:hypothetical protein